MSKPALGRGLGALLSGGGAKSAPAAPVQSPATPAPAAAPGGSVLRVPVARVHPSTLQPRKDFTAESLEELAESIRRQGIVQPLIVRSSPNGYELIAGERRWRAAQLAGLTEVPIVERVASDREVLELALVENLQRENLNPIEEALGYSQLASQFSLTQEDIAARVGRSRAAVANALRLLKLPPAAQTALRDGRLSVGHAKVLLGIADAKNQLAAFERVLSANLSVRQTEELAARLIAPEAPAKPGTAAPVAAGRDLFVVDLENRLRERFATKVGLRYRTGRGSLEIRFSSDDELNRVLALLGVPLD
jgi:ParB family chromosome partitioning protein